MTAGQVGTDSLLIERTPSWVRRSAVRVRLIVSRNGLLTIMRVTDGLCVPDPRKAKSHELQSYSVA
jgi:hypothetical protein